jgi:hypothetical protein
VHANMAASLATMLVLLHHLHLLHHSKRWCGS